MVTLQLLRRLIQAREMLDAAPALPLQVIARRVHLSRAHFIRRFAAAFGETPHQYRIRRRLELAKRLLAGAPRQVTDVCFSAGFASLGSFSWSFARRFGEPPSSYGRRLRSAGPRERTASAVAPGCFSLMGGAHFSRSAPHNARAESSSPPPFEDR